MSIKEQKFSTYVHELLEQDDYLKELKSMKAHILDTSIAMQNEIISQYDTDIKCRIEEIIRQARINFKSKRVGSHIGQSGAGSVACT